MLKNNKGFTLLEVIIAITILAMVVGTLLRSFAFSAKLNKRAYDTDMANALALSEAEKIKKDCAMYMVGKTKETKYFYLNESGNKIKTTKNNEASIIEEKTTGTKYFDIQWNEVLDKDSEDVKFVMEIVVNNTNTQNIITSYSENTYMDDHHVHLMVEKYRTLIGIITGNDTPSSSRNREYHMDVDSYTSEISLDTMKEIMKNWKAKVNSKEKTTKKRITFSELKNTLREAVGTKDGSYAQNNNYGVGKRKPRYWPIHNKEYTAESIDKLKAEDAVPIRFLFPEESMPKNRKYRVYIVNLIDKDINFYVEYSRDGNRKSVHDMNQVDVENPMKYLVDSAYLFDTNESKFGNVNIMKTNFFQNNDKDTYSVDVIVKRKDKNEIIGSYHTGKFKLYEIR
ncbi:type IV pilus modification PilV family protein [Crassaminicella profunda]|uniref:type IV pilus modification PilV family protein n=1 Tax=Crassaminicella profunda TaxID=1286698 RepID=UPI001CA786CE|nr:prepilin-type N-terminal cleavage/methylation domain-containing protein [Crassaminicella profunda]QZY55263.1 prepilin-type N-terminal cleavage/methylation domain-containing protein [Crassaminicella profunda]